MVPAVLHCTSCRDSRFWAPLAPSARKRWISWQSSLTSSSLWHWLLAPILSYCPSRFASAFSVSVIVTLRPQAGEPWAACASERIAMHLWQAHVSSLFAVAHTADQAIQAQDGGNQGWQSNCRTQGADQGLQWWPMGLRCLCPHAYKESSCQSIQIGASHCLCAHHAQASLVIRQCSRP